MLIDRDQNKSQHLKARAPLSKKDALRLQSDVITFLRFPLAVMIVAIHCVFDASVFTSGDVHIESEMAVKIIDFLGLYMPAGAVQLFFLMSGYLFFLKTPQLNAKIYLQKTKKSIFTLLLPFLVWNLIGAFFVDHPYTNVIYGFWNYPFVGALWFIRDLFVVRLFSPIINWMINKCGLLWIMLLLVLDALGYNTILVSGISVISFLYFSIGALIAIKYRYISSTLSSWSWKYWTPLLVCVFILLDYFIGTTDGVLSRILHQSAVNIKIFIILVISGIIVYKGINKDVFAKLGAASFVIFVLHNFIYKRIWHIGVLLLGHDNISAFEAVTLYLIVVVSTVAICYGGYLMINRFKCTDILLNGGRSKK